MTNITPIGAGSAEFPQGRVPESRSIGRVLTQGGQPKKTWHA